MSGLLLPGSQEWLALMRGDDAPSSGDAPDDLSDIFPPADPGFEPFGRLIVIQLRTPKEKTDGGIYLSDETRANEQWNEMTGRVVSIGPLCFKRSEDLTPWPEGAWCKVDDIVRVKKWVGDRTEVPLGDGRKALFVTTDDYNLIGRVTRNPRSIKAWV